MLSKDGSSKLKNLDKASKFKVSPTKNKHNYALPEIATDFYKTDRIEVSKCEESQRMDMIGFINLNCCNY